MEIVDRWRLQPILFLDGLILLEGIFSYEHLLFSLNGALSEEENVFLSWQNNHQSDILIILYKY